MVIGNDDTFSCLVISVPVLSKAYEGWMARELKSRQDAQRVREDDMVTALGHAMEQASHWKAEAARHRDMYLEYERAVSRGAGREFAGTGDGSMSSATLSENAPALQTRRNLHLDEAASDREPGRDWRSGPAQRSNGDTHESLSSMHHSSPEVAMHHPKGVAGTSLSLGRGHPVPRGRVILLLNRLLVGLFNSVVRAVILCRDLIRVAT